MKEVFLLNYSVSGIKSLDKEINLSFYKDRISRPLDFSNYNVKGIYGMNGTGKSAIISSVEILKSILLRDDYLTNNLVQRKLEELINKKTKECSFCVEFVADYEDSKKPFVYRYKLAIGQSENGRIIIKHERLSVREYTTKADSYYDLIRINDGLVEQLETKSDDLRNDLIDYSKNLLFQTSSCQLFIQFIFNNKEFFLSKEKNGNNGKYVNEKLVVGVISTGFFASSLSVYLDVEDDHTDYLINDLITEKNIVSDQRFDELFEFLRDSFLVNRIRNSILKSRKIEVPKALFSKYEVLIGRLCTFLKLFKNDLFDIKIEKQENNDYYSCDLVLVYKDYSVDVEFESTGIKKLIRLFTHLCEMNDGGIVFIDELDSNLHDVYLCALLAYLSEYADGQLCFTSHNIGPMDILKSKKKSLEFLSINHTITSWVSNKYSPVKLYRSGMVEGSPFNIEAMDFIGMFDGVEV